MRKLILDYIDTAWTPGFEYEFDINQIDLHLLSDDELFELFLDLVRKYG
jgi:hypothetical protein